MTNKRILVTRKYITRKPTVHVVPLPLSALPELKSILEPFFGSKGRGHVVMVRLGDDAVSRLDDLVEAGLFGSRSEAAAFLVGAGIRAQRELFEKIAQESAAIKKMRASLRQAALESLRGTPEGPKKRRRTR